MKRFVIVSLLLRSATGSADATPPPADSLVSCPRPSPGDKDGDGIADHLDKCPGEPEAWNGFEDEDGCPDKGTVVVSADRIETVDKLFFEAGKDAIKPVSLPLLSSLATALKHVCGGPVVEVGVHSDARGADEFNLKLTQARAEAVMRALVERGVPASRLRARGYGETAPLCSEPNESCWSRNRRTEFVRKP